MGLLALGGLASVNESPAPPSRSDELLSRTRLWLPYLPLLLAALVGLGHAVGQMKHGPMLAALGVLAVAVLVRQFFVLVENRSLLSEVAREAFRDSLTGLANRAYFLHRLEQAVARRRHDIAPFAVLCLDLDNFKAVNDALGHPAGDELLVRVAGRITAALDDKGTVARLGGDEFAVLLEGSVEESQTAAHRVLEAFGAPIVIDGRSHVGAAEHRLHGGHRRFDVHRRPAAPARRPGHVYRQTRRRPMHPQLRARRPLSYPLRQLTDSTG